MTRQLKWGDISTLRYGKGLRDYPKDPTDSYSFRVFGTNGPIGYHSKPLVGSAGIIVGRKGAYRGIHFSPSPFYVIDTAYYLDISDPGVNLKWAYYNLLTVDINRMDSGSAIPSTNRNDFAALHVTVPPLPTQQRVAEILSAYDDLIENNRRRMELLEASARQLYEEWFVRLRFPGHEHTKITKGVPDGWELRPLSECSQFRSGGTPKKSIPEYWDGDIPWISSGEMPHWRLHDSVRKVTEDGAENGTRMVSPGTILAVVRGMSLAKEFRVAMCSRPVTFNQDLKAIVANDDIQPEYLYAAILSQREQIRDRSTEASHGTKKLDTAVLSSTEIKVPTPSLQQAFCDHVQPKHQLWDRCWNQNVKLKAARDHLLPRLMSGEVPV